MCVCLFEFFFFTIFSIIFTKHFTAFIYVLKTPISQPRPRFPYHPRPLIARPRFYLSIYIYFSYNIHIFQLIFCSAHAFIYLLFIFLLYPHFQPILCPAHASPHHPRPYITPPLSLPPPKQPVTQYVAVHEAAVLDAAAGEPTDFFSSEVTTGKRRHEG